MTVASKINAEMLRSTFKNASAKRGEKLLREFMREGHDQQASYLLRHHRTIPITSHETYPRDDIDQLLSYYSILYIAIEAGAVDPTAHIVELQRIKSVLGYQPLAAYYGEIYRLRVPISFQAYLRDFFESTSRVIERFSEDGGNLRLFFHFFDLSATFEFDSDIEWFLWIMDGGSRNGWSVRRLVATLANPELGAEVFFSESPNPGQRILRGLLKFLELCLDLDKLTAEETAEAGLRYHFLCYYEYWFRATQDKLKSDLSENTERLLEILFSQDSDINLYVDAFKDLTRRIESLSEGPTLGARAPDDIEREMN